MSDKTTGQKKACKTCGKVKPFTDFYRDRRLRSSYFTECKVCTRLRNVAWRKVNPERHAASKKAWQKANIELVSIDQKLWKKKNSDKVQEVKQRYAKRHPEKIQCWRVVNSAVRIGKIVKKPCIKCGITEDIHAHHEDYTQPHQITWLCRKHHTELHNKLRNRRVDTETIQIETGS